MKFLFTKSAAGVTAFAMALSFIPVLHAQEGTTTASGNASEQLVASPTDKPLERQAKLERSWTVFREKGSTQICAITKDGKKREIQTLAFFTAFDANYMIKLVADGRLDAMPTGDPITSMEGLKPEDFRKAPPMCRLVRTEEHPAVHLMCGNERRVILREGVFHQFGWEFRDVETVPTSEINATTETAAIDEQTIFEEGVEVQGTENRELREHLTERLNLQGKNQVRTRLVKPIGHPEVYVIMPDGTKRHIADMEAVRAHKLNLRQTTEVTEDEIAAFPEGPALTAGASETVVLDATVAE